MIEFGATVVTVVAMREVDGAPISAKLNDLVTVHASLGVLEELFEFHKSAP